MLKLVKKALQIKKSFGTYRAARYLAKRGVSCDAAVGILATPVYERMVRIDEQAKMLAYAGAFQ